VKELVSIFSHDLTLGTAGFGSFLVAGSDLKFSKETSAILRP
jgi:hypothetical protein